MSRFYSKRLLWPFTGVVQVAELDWARALSLDGMTWALRYTEDEDPKKRNGPLWYDPRVNCALEVTINGDKLETHIDHPDLTPKQAQADGQRLLEALGSTKLPFAAADHYEYWLLDEKDERPLALLYSCIEEEGMQQPAPPPMWRAMPTEEPKVQNPKEPLKTDTPTPIYYRMESLVKARAGREPRAAWFQRKQGDTEDFPPLLLREDWEDKEAERLCELYLRRLSPWLLMLSGLPESKREWLEQAALENVSDVERFFRLYPEEVDRKFITAARVEARMRQAAQA